MIHKKTCTNEFVYSIRWGVIFEYLNFKYGVVLVQYITTNISYLYKLKGSNYSYCFDIQRIMKKANCG